MNTLTQRIAAAAIDASKKWDNSFKVASKGRSTLGKVLGLLDGNIKKIPRLHKLYWGYKGSDPVKGAALVAVLLDNYSKALSGFSLILESSEKGYQVLGYTKSESEKAISGAIRALQEAADYLKEVKEDFAKDGGKYLESRLSNMANKAEAVSSEVAGHCPFDIDAWTLQVAALVHRGVLPRAPHQNPNL